MGDFFRGLEDHVRQKNVDYNNNHNNNALYLLTTFRCLQLVN